MATALVSTLAVVLFVVVIVLSIALIHFRGKKTHADSRRVLSRATVSSNPEQMSHGVTVDAVAQSLGISQQIRGTLLSHGIVHLADAVDHASWIGRIDCEPEDQRLLGTLVRFAHTET